LKARGFAVGLFDSTFATLADFETTMQVERPSLVGLYCNLMTKQNVLHMIKICQQMGSKVILGGPEPINYVQEYLEFGADVVVSGEGELTLEELIPLFAQSPAPDLSSVLGIVWRDGNGRIQHNPPRPFIKNLSEQPWPDREAIDLEKYLQTWQTHHGVRSTSLITARGCAYQCKWCSHSVFGYSHRRRSPQDVADEVAWLVDRYQPDQLWYADDVLTVAHRWFLQYAAELKQRHLRVPFECISRADRLNETIIDTLAEMGCYRLWIGAESGSQNILDAMLRKADVTDIQQKTKMLQARGIEVGMFIMLGYQGETIDDIEATVEHLKKSAPDVFLTTVAYPIKGTKYYEEVAEKVQTEEAWALRTDRDLGVNGRYSPRFYDHATRWMVNAVNLHKARQSGSRDWLHLGKMYLNVQRGRWGMRLTQHQREGDKGQNSGRGWSAKERTADAW
jgi:radical SAM superfamily enzyme YgiQ (UPF0313 family)